ncbi:MAG: energy transducer TonB [Candidatus Cloacimonetes bacterium]|nr:energy transducer TonB [Candidatus Cloacimonadota bacterium]
MREEKRRTIISLISSLLIHLIIIVLLLFNQKKNPEQLEEIDNRIVFEIVESSSEESEKPDKETNLVSDKDQKSLDAINNDTRIAGTQGEEKIEDMNSLPPINIDKSAIEDFFEKEQTQSQEKPDRLYDYKPERKDFFTVLEHNRKKKQLSLDYDKVFDSVIKSDGIVLNTYKWEFAPYLLAMKKKIQQHIKPPYAFTHLGAISGDVLVRFIVMPDGEISKIDVIHQDTHSSLVSTSVNAVKYSSKLQPLPGNFPEKYLEVTALFSYIINKSK